MENNENMCCWVWTMYIRIYLLCYFLSFFGIQAPRILKEYVACTDVSTRIKDLGAQIQDLGAQIQDLLAPKS